MNNDRFVAVTYIPPENSPVHAIYNFDIFHKLETEINHFSMLGEVYLIGDLNCRTGQKCDYIVNDFILKMLRIMKLTWKSLLGAFQRIMCRIDLVIACLTCVKPLK